MTHRLSIEQQEISTTIVWDAVNRRWIVESADELILPTLRSVAAQTGTSLSEQEGRARGVYPERAELGEGNWSPQAKARIQFGVIYGRPIAPAPLPTRIGPRVVIDGPERPESYSSVSEVIQIQGPAMKAGGAR